MRFANGYSASPSFSLQSLEKDAKNVIDKDDVMRTEDFEGAYHKVNMEHNARPFQCFWWEDKIFCATVMLFGWCLAPFFFTKICKAPAQFFGALLIKLLNYLDDWIFATSAGKIHELAAFVQFVLIALGWSFNKKSEEGTRVKFVGYIIDSSLHCFEVPADKIQRAQGMVSELLNTCKQGWASSDLLQTFLGTTQSFRLAIPAVSVWTRNLYSGMVWTRKRLLKRKLQPLQE